MRIYLSLRLITAIARARSRQYSIQQNQLAAMSLRKLSLKEISEPVQYPSYLILLKSTFTKPSSHPHCITSLEKELSASLSPPFIFKSNSLCTPKAEFFYAKSLVRDLGLGYETGWLLLAFKQVSPAAVSCAFQKSLFRECLLVREVDREGAERMEGWVGVLVWSYLPREGKLMGNEGSWGSAAEWRSEALCLRQVEFFACIVLQFFNQQYGKMELSRNPESTFSSKKNYLKRQPLLCQRSFQFYRATQSYWPESAMRISQFAYINEQAGSEELAACQKAHKQPKLTTLVSAVAEECKGPP